MYHKVKCAENERCRQEKKVFEPRMCFSVAGS